MINFAPDVFVTLYLQHTDQLDSATSTKVFEHIISGFQNQLKFEIFSVSRYKSLQKTSKQSIILINIPNTHN